MLSQNYENKRFTILEPTNVWTDFSENFMIYKRRKKLSVSKCELFGRLSNKQ